MESILYVVLSGYDRGCEIKYFYYDTDLRFYLLENISSHLEEEGEEEQIALIENLSIRELIRKAREFGKIMKQNNQGCWIETVDIFKSKTDIHKTL